MICSYPLEALGNVAEISTGGGAPQNADDFSAAGHPFVRAGSLKPLLEGKSESCLEHLTEGVARSHRLQLFPAGSVLFAKSGMSATKGHIYKLKAPAFVVNHLAAITCSTKLDAGYLYHSLRVFSPMRLIRDEAYPSIRLSDISSMKIPLPTLPEQIRIAAILDQADALRAKRRAALALLDSLTQSVFIEMFGDPVTNPMEWQVTPLEKVAEKITDGEHQTPKRTEFGIKLLSARNIRDGYLDFGDVDFIDVAEHQKISKRCNPERGDILISCSGSIGRVAIVETDEPLGLVRSVALVKPNHQKILSKYLETFLRTPHMNRMMINKAHSSSQANLFQGPIRALPIALPPIALQQEFVEKSVALQTLRNLHNAANAELDNLFASLQHRAFRGEL